MYLMAVSHFNVYLSCSHKILRHFVLHVMIGWCGFILQESVGSSLPIMVVAVPEGNVSAVNFTFTADSSGLETRRHVHHSLH